MTIKKFYVYVDVKDNSEEDVISTYQRLESIPGYRCCGVQRPVVEESYKLSWFDITSAIFSTIGLITVATLGLSYL